MGGLSQSSFFKWRCLIALAAVDAKLDPAEKKFFSDELKKLEDEGISEEQMSTLIDDLKNPKQPEVFFVRVDDAWDKIDLLRMAYFLFMSDDEFEAREKQVYDHLKEKIAKNLDVSEEILDDIAKVQGNQVSIRSLLKEKLGHIKTSGL